MGDSAKFLDGSSLYGWDNTDESTEFFEKTVVDSFIEKLQVGIDVPNYPQFRDMNQMFVYMMEGIEKIDAGYIETKNASLRSDNNKIAEVLVIERNAQLIQEKTGKPFELRVCITGPYTLSSLFPYRDEKTFLRLGKVIAQILDCNLFNNKNGRTSVVSVDEPTFGLVDDPLIDFGSQGRDNLQKAWETIFHKIKTKNAQGMIHLHSTANAMFWDIPSLDIIDSHVDDPLHKMEKTGKLLESKDKFLKASMTVNDFDELIRQKIVAEAKEKMSDSDINEKIADTWTEIKKRRVDPDIFLETSDEMKKRVTDVIERFGENRILYAGPECGLKGYPTYKNAIECLRRIATAVNNLKK
jgi:5-methyltetrahydropteroyltriglutamate--homocysteine methyltransferase